MATVDSTKGKQEGWLSCQLDKGMFSDEVAVTYPPTGELRKSVFVPAESVEGRIGDVGKVQVMLLNRSGKLLAVLPSPQHDVVEIAAGDFSDSNDSFQR